MIKIPNKNYRKGYRFEYQIKKKLEKDGWLVVRSGRSLGIADLIAIKDRMVLFLQLKATKGKIFYYKGEMRDEIQGFPFRLVVRFDRRKTIVTEPKKKITPEDGIEFSRFLELVEQVKNWFDGVMQIDVENVPQMEINLSESNLRYIG